MKSALGRLAGRSRQNLLPLAASLLLLTTGAPAHGDYFDGFACGQALPAGLQLEYTDIPRLLTWFTAPDPRQDLGGVISGHVSYLFWDGRFYGKVCPIVGQHQINAVLRFFRQELKRIYTGQPEAGAFRHPVERRDDAWVFIQPELIVIVRRFSVHLGQVEILCRDAYERRTGKRLPSSNAPDP